MELEKFLKQKKAANWCIKSFGATKRFKSRHKKLVEQVNIAICKEKNLLKAGEIKNLSPKTKLTSREVEKAYANFRKFCREAVDNLLAQD